MALLGLSANLLSLLVCSSPVVYLLRRLLTLCVALPCNCIWAVGRVGNAVTLVRPRTARHVDMFYRPLA